MALKSRPQFTPAPYVGVRIPWKPMFDFEIENIDSERLIAAFNASEIRNNGRYVFSQMELEGSTFQIIYPDQEVKVSEHFKNLASKAISELHRLNRIAKDNTPEGEAGEHSLHYIKLSESEVELHYVYNLANASSGVYFKIEENGSLVFDDWG